MLFTIGGCNAGWHSIRTSAGYSDFDPPGASQADAALEKSRLGKLCVTNKTRHPISTSSAFFFVATCFLRTATIFCPGLGRTDNPSDADEKMEFLKRSEAQLEKLEQLIASLMNISRLETAMISLTKEPIGARI